LYSSGTSKKNPISGRSVVQDTDFATDGRGFDSCGRHVIFQDVPMRSLKNHWIEQKTFEQKLNKPPVYSGTTITIGTKEE
jgi:hypothetical protein